MEDAGVTEKVSDGGTVAEGTTPVGVRLPGLLFGHALSARLKTPLPKVVMGTREASRLR